MKLNREKIRAIRQAHLDSLPKPEATPGPGVIERPPVNRTTLGPDGRLVRLPKRPDTPNRLKKVES